MPCPDNILPHGFGGPFEVQVRVLRYAAAKHYELWIEDIGHNGQALA